MSKLKRFYVVFNAHDAHTSSRLPKGNFKEFASEKEAIEEVREYNLGWEAYRCSCCGGINPDCQDCGGSGYY